ncbi:hypothetical protein IQ06DRAFT_146789 [Phaeosphaeriaceae sp. SRC1lsM3a]|nr:hypothetical protein IQ06DRAFT_146789 [Stagonospora sp. SRC1lsM3a]
MGLKLGEFQTCWCAIFEPQEPGDHSLNMLVRESEFSRGRRDVTLSRSGDIQLLARGWPCRLILCALVSCAPGAIGLILQLTSNDLVADQWSCPIPPQRVFLQPLIDTRSQTWQW